MMNVDIVASAGSSIGPLPADRAFTGGTRFSDVLLEHPLAAEDYLWMGPLLRGYGASQFHLPTTPNILTTSGTSFAGISFTAGLPGWSKLLFYSSKPEYEKQLHATADELTALTRARALYDYLQIESDPAKAENRAAKRVATTKRVLHSLIDHTKEVSLRPILAYDRATLFSRAQNSVTDWSVGGGVRLWIRGAKAEVLYFRNGGILPEGKSYNLTIKVSMRVGVHPDYVDLK
jgi:hypothetical protein